MKKDKKLIVGVIGVLSIVATTSMATPAYAMSADVLKGHSTVQSVDNYANKASTQKATQSSTAQTTVQSAQQQLQYGFNVVNNDPNQIYFANAQGVKQTGWVKSELGWVYANSNGVVQRSKWIQDGSAWYYVGARGIMLTEYMVDGYYVNKSGAWSFTPSSYVPAYTADLVGTKSVPIKDIEAGIANGTIKAQVIHNSATMGATQKGTGDLTLYYAK